MSQSGGIKLLFTRGKNRADKAAATDGSAAATHIKDAEHAGAWQLAWWKFRRHRLAVVSGIVVICIYLVAAFAEFLAPQGAGDYSARYTYAPPQRLLAPGAVNPRTPAPRTTSA